jgi:imidazole glycerol-phosphate synthase subunit HisH
MISIIDYGAGNLKSISNALKKVGADIEVAAAVNRSADAIVLPGVGSFGDAMEKIAPFKQDMIDAISDGKPFLGLCLGLQVLFEGSEEAPGVKGLGLIKGDCKRFDEARVPSGKVPHMGWNGLQFRVPSSEPAPQNPIFEGISEGESFYFVHSFYAPLVEETSAACNYGQDFSAAVQKKNVFACQFHPERSGEAGLRVLENFVRLARK